MVGETLEEVRFVGPDAEMMELHLRLGPRQGDRALEGGRVMVLVDQVESLVAGRRDQRPERDAGRGPRRNPHAAAKTEDRDRARCRRCWRAVARRSPRSALRMLRPRPRKRARSVSNCTSPTALAFHDGEVRRPDLRLAGRPPPPRGQQGADVGDELRLDEQLGEGRVCCVGRRRRQHDLGIGGQLDLAGAVPRFEIETRRTSASSSGETATSSVVVSDPSRRTISARSSENATS